MKKFELSGKESDSACYTIPLVLLFTDQQRLGLWFIKDLWCFPTQEMHIYMHITVLLFSLQNSRIRITVLCKRMEVSTDYFLLSKELWYVQEAAYCKVKILLFLNKKRATLLYINESVPEEEKGNTVVDWASKVI